MSWAANRDEERLVRDPETLFVATDDAVETTGNRHGPIPGEEPSSPGTRLCRSMVNEALRRRNRRGLRRLLRRLVPSRRRSREERLGRDTEALPVATDCAQDNWEESPAQSFTGQECRCPDFHFDAVHLMKCCGGGAAGASEAIRKACPAPPPPSRGSLAGPAARVLLIERVAV